MIRAVLRDDEIPYFAWDRAWTVRDIADRLHGASGFEWTRIASWILREAAFDDVWRFLGPEEVRDHLEELLPLLGRSREFWKYIIGAWHKLGKF